MDPVCPAREPGRVSVASNEEEGDDAAQALVQIRLPSEPSLLT